MTKKKEVKPRRSQNTIRDSRSAEKIKPNILTKNLQIKRKKKRYNNRVSRYQYDQAKTEEEIKDRVTAKLSEDLSKQRWIAWDKPTQIPTEPSSKVDKRSKRSRIYNISIWPKWRRPDHKRTTQKRKWHRAQRSSTILGAYKKLKEYLKQHGQKTIWWIRKNRTQWPPKNPSYPKIETL